MVCLKHMSRRRRELMSDNLVVQWGVQDNYEIVRKVGRGKYSEVSIGLHYPPSDLFVNQSNAGEGRGKRSSAVQP